MIDSYVQKDPTAFCSYQDYLLGVETFQEFCLLRSKSIRGQLEGQLAKCRICSPIEGTVLAKYAQAGELAVAGKPLMKVADVNNIHLKAYLVSSQLPQVKLGQKVKVYADFGGDEKREYEGTVTWISDRSEFTPKNIVTSDDRANMVYAIKIAVPNDGYLKIGMYGGIKL